MVLDEVGPESRALVGDDIHTAAGEMHAVALPDGGASRW